MILIYGLFLLCLLVFFPIGLVVLVVLKIIGSLLEGIKG